MTPYVVTLVVTLSHIWWGIIDPTVYAFGSFLSFAVVGMVYSVYQINREYRR